MSDEVRVLSMKDRDAAVEVLVAAFEHERHMSWTFPRATSRRRYLRTLTTFMIREGSLLGIGEPLVGVAAFSPFEGVNFLRLSFWKLVLIIVLTPRLVTSARLANAHEPKGASLSVGPIAVHPSRGGHGLGSALMLAIKARAAELGLPVILETADARAFYEKIGFREIASYDLDGIPMFVMEWVPQGVSWGSDPTATYKQLRDEKLERLAQGCLALFFGTCTLFGTIAAWYFSNPKSR